MKAMHQLPERPHQSGHERKNTKGRTKKVLLILIASIIILSNTPPAQFFLLPSYSYQNRDASFTYSEEPGKGMDFTAGEIRFANWKQRNPDNPNQTLYRTFRIKPWEFWQWWQFIAHWERFAVPVHPDA